MADEVKSNPVPQAESQDKFRFGLRTLFIAIVVLAVPIAWIANLRYLSRRDMHIVELLREKCEVSFTTTGRIQPRDESVGGEGHEGPVHWRETKPLELGQRVVGLRITRPSAAEIELISGLTGLLHLDVESPQVETLTPFGVISNLETLVIDNTDVGDVTPLAKLTRLQFLKLTNAAVNDASPLASLPNLELVDLSHNPISDVSQFVKFRSLINLRLNSTKVIDLSPLATMNNLRFLQIKHTDVSNITPLFGLPHLEQVWLFKTKVDDAQISTLRKTLNWGVISAEKIYVGA